MTYTTPNGYIIESLSSPMVYQCECQGIPDGTYESIETEFASTSIGIQQIKIVREVKDNQMTITITQSTNQELIDYQNSIAQEQPLDVNQLIG